MPGQELTSIVVAITVAEMMAAIGLEVRAAELRTFTRDLPLIARAALANYVAVPAVTVWCSRRRLVTSVSR